MELKLYKGTKEEIILNFEDNKITMQGYYNCTELTIITKIFYKYQFYLISIPTNLFSAVYESARDNFIYNIYKELEKSTLIEECNDAKSQLPSKYIGRTLTQSFHITKDSVLKELLNNLNNMSEIIGKYLFIDSGKMELNKYSYKNENFKNISEIIEDYKSELNRLK